MTRDFGQELMDFIIDGGLLWVDPEIIKPEYDGGLIVWSANAASQLQSKFKELAQMT